jgi:hypothetical protein
MSDRTDLSFNSGDPDPRWQANLLALARALPYPATPDVRAVVMARVAGPGRAPRIPRRVLGRPVRLAYMVVLAAILIALLALLAVPSVRAALLDFLQIGAVRIFLSPTIEPTLNRTPAATGTPAASPAPQATPVPTATPSPTPVLSVLDLAGQTTFEAARQRAGFTIRLPTYPPDLGQPDAAFVQDIDGRIVILVWLDPNDRTKVRLSLQFINSTAAFDKMISLGKQQPAGVEFAQVNGEVALWTTGPYILETRAGAFIQQRLIKGHVLIWRDGILTYRLETNQSMAEAVKVAESLGK